MAADTLCFQGAVSAVFTCILRAADGIACCRPVFSRATDRQYLFLGAAERIRFFVIGHGFPTADVCLIPFGFLLFIICWLDVGGPSMGCQPGIVFFAFIPCVSYQSGRYIFPYLLKRESTWAYPLSVSRLPPRRRIPNLRHTGDCRPASAVRFSWRLLSSA